MDHIRELMAIVLESLECEVAGEAENGEAAVELYKRQRPDVVLLDIKMPVMDGVAALKAIKALNPDAFVVMITSVSDMDVMSECYAAGAVHYLRKDTPVQEMMEAIKESWLERLLEEAGE